MVGSARAGRGSEEPVARRVRRVKRTRRVIKTKAPNATQGVGGVPGSAASGDWDGPDPGTLSGHPHLNRKRTMKGKGKKGVGGIDGDLGLDLEDLSEVEADSGVGSASGVRRKGMGGDGFDDGGKGGREAYESYMKSHVKEDAQRFESLRQSGAQDTFDPDATPDAVERQGQIRSAAHMVRLYDHWTLQGVDRAGAIEKAAGWLGGFSRTDNIRKVLTELESKPIRDVYPLEVMLELLEKDPKKLPGVKLGSLLSAAPALQEDRVFAGHGVQLPVPRGVRLKAFALIGGERPGYEFHPTATKDDQYTLLVDTPGTWEFALLGVQTQALGKMMKELPGGVIERLKINVKEMGKAQPHGGAEA